MQIDTAGTYLLKYTAEDACGNITEVTREVVAEAPPTYRTVLYTDGTFIINESSRDQVANEALHGAATDVYIPFDPNGNTDVEKYNFISGVSVPWGQRVTNITAVEIGSSIKPINTRVWFQNLSNCTEFNLANLDTSEVTNMNRMFVNCKSVLSVDLSNFQFEKVTDMREMFLNCQELIEVDLGVFDTSEVTTFSKMFDSCSALETIHATFGNNKAFSTASMFNRCTKLKNFNISAFDTHLVTDMSKMFNNMDSVAVLDVSSFDTSSVTNMSEMFQGCDILKTIIVSDKFTTANVSNSNWMFYNSYALVGGAGTPYNPSYQDATYARIDNPPDAPGYFTLKSA